MKPAHAVHGLQRTPHRRYGLWRKGLSATAAACFALLLLSGCASPFTRTATSHDCADKVARATVQGSVPGLWKCLSSDFQTTMHALGHDGDGALIKEPFALTAKYMGSSTGVEVYDLVLLPAVAQEAGVSSVVLVVYVDKNGLATNVGIPTPVF